MARDRTRPRPPSQLVEDYSRRVAMLRDEIRATRRGEEPVRVLEAGCGQVWPIGGDDPPLHLTGVDLDVDALRIRRETHGDLDVEIVGDLRTMTLPEAAFDVVFCAYVLEHVTGAEQVLEGLLRAARPGGRVIVRVPDRDTVYGLVVRHSPHRLHVLFKKHVEGFPLAGMPGHAPYPAVYDRIVSLRGLYAFAEAHDADVVHDHASDSAVGKLGRLAPVADRMLRAIAWASGGRLLATHTDICVVLRRR